MNKISLLIRRIIGGVILAGLALGIIAFIGVLLKLIETCNLLFIPLIMFVIVLIIKNMR